jgi:hypothetical protein
MVDASVEGRPTAPPQSECPGRSRHLWPVTRARAAVAARRRRARYGAAIGLLLLSLGGACGGRTPPQIHRPVGTSCTTTRGPGCAPSSDGPCVSSDCDAGENGRCTPFLSFPCACTYDQCFQDSDCPPKTPCLCRATASDSSANVCLTGSNCAVDSDCGPNGFCSPSITNTCIFTHYFCHTAQDSCINDSDCSALKFSACMFDEQAGRWQCEQCFAPP